MCKAAHQAALVETQTSFAVELCRRAPAEAQSWCILADAAARQSSMKLAMLAYHQSWRMSRDERVSKYCIQVSKSPASNHKLFLTLLASQASASKPPLCQISATGNAEEALPKQVHQPKDKTSASIGDIEIFCILRSAPSLYENPVNLQQ